MRRSDLQVVEVFAERYRRSRFKHHAAGQGVRFDASSWRDCRRPNPAWAPFPPRSRTSRRRRRRSAPDTGSRAPARRIGGGRRPSEGSDLGTPHMLEHGRVLIDGETTADHVVEDHEVRRLFTLGKVGGRRAAPVEVQASRRWKDDPPPGRPPMKETNACLESDASKGRIPPDRCPESRRQRCRRVDRPRQSTVSRVRPIPPRPSPLRYAVRGRRIRCPARGMLGDGTNAEGRAWAAGRFDPVKSPGRGMPGRKTAAGDRQAPIRAP